VGWRRILALVAGLVGVLIIIRPGMTGFDLFATFTLLGVAGMAIRDFGTRIMPREISTAALSFYGSLTIVLMGMAMIVFSGDWRPPTGEGMRYIVGLVVVGSLGTLAVSTAMRLGDVSVISPFRYVRVVFGVGAGILVFGETVDLPILLGSAIVIGAGLYSWMRERKLTLKHD
jgi:drug/metabolite transporter (DMT)-like permease